MKFFKYEKMPNKQIIYCDDLLVYEKHNLCIVFKEVEKFLSMQEIKMQEIDKINALEILQNDESFLKQKELLEVSKEALIKKINEEYEKAMKSLDGEASDSEKATYQEQEKQALMFLKTKLESDAPMLSIMSKARDESLEELCEKVLKKAEIFKILAGTFLGQKQGLIKQVKESLFLNELELIKVEFKNE